VLAFNQDLYDLLKYLHIVAAVVWVGSGLFVQYYASRLRRAQDPARLGAFAKDIEAAGKQLFAPASVTVLVMGLLMVWYSPALGFSETWILIGIAGFIATFITGNFFLGPTAGKIGGVIDAEGPASANAQALIQRIVLVSRIDQVVLLLVILAMVFKPGG
jgi:uncharacterized membrane protein